MANPIARILAAAVIPALLLSGCGRTIQPALPAIAKGHQAPVAAKGVSPDHEATLSGDIRRAKYWMADAELVMAVHSTNFNTTAISASANVFYSQEAFLSGKTCVFVARHYGIRPIAQYTESPDYNRLAGRLKAIGAYSVKAEEAWRIARSYAPAPAAGQVAAKPKLALSSRAFLIQPEGGTAQWNFYSGNVHFTIDAGSRAVLDMTGRVNPNDRLNAGMEVDLQRAAIAWLPTNRGGDNIITEPQPTN
jgi:hypothetical protein